MKRLRMSARLFRALVALCFVTCLVIRLADIEAAIARSRSPAQAMEATVFAVTAGNNLISFNSVTPGMLLSTTPITGLQSGERILGLDFRPRTARLFALGSSSRLYSINTTTGAATQVGAAVLTPALDGTAFGFDFNPVVDLIRVVSDRDQNLRLSPTTGAVAGEDTTLAYAAGDANAGANPNVAGAGYTNNLFGATATTLFGIDSNLDILVRQGSADGAPTSPNAGQLSTVGALGIDTAAEVGFDIAGLNGTALASLTPPGAASSSLCTIDLSTGAATLIGSIGGGELIRDLAILGPAPLASISAASFSPNPTVASESIVAGFGSGLATSSEPAATIPLPTSLNGATVNVRDSGGTARPAGLFFVGPGQINYQIPPGTINGMATIIVTSGSGAVSAGMVQIATIAPGLFAANANGQGAPAAVVLRVRADGSSVFEPVAQFDFSQSRFVPAPIDLGPETDQVFLVLFGTGIRFRSSLAAAGCQIGGTSSDVLFAGELQGFVGLDQVNVGPLPRSLMGRGEVDLVLIMDGLAANTLRVNMR